MVGGEAAREASHHQSGLLPWRAESCCQPQPLTVLCITYVLISRESAPLSRTSDIVARTPAASAMTLEPQPVLGANHGELGGREELCEALEQAY